MTGFGISLLNAEIVMRSGVDRYNITWNPGRSFTLEYAVLNITGCNFDIHLQLLDREANESLMLCAVTCPNNEEITDAAARQDCNGTGCCSFRIASRIRAFSLIFVRHGRGELEVEANPSGSSLWNRINVTSCEAYILWSIADQQSCYSSNSDNTTASACVSKNSKCNDNYWTSTRGYYCSCDTGYLGNPYIDDGCSKDTGKLQK